MVQLVVTPPHVSQGLVLLVDDYEDTLDLYSEYLRFHGYNVTVARNGQEAVDIARTERPALILMDLQMPGMSGMKALRILRADEAFARTPIVALTAHALEAERVDALRGGFDEVIPKPRLPDTLMAAVERLLTTARQD